MTPKTGLILCLAYLLGLIATAIPGQILSLPLGGIGLFVIGMVAAWQLPNRWRLGPRRWVWLVAGAVGLLASLYLLFRLPHPGSQDISHWLPKTDATAKAPVVQVVGRVTSTPRLTRSQRVQFWLEVTGFNSQAQSDPSLLPEQQVRGNLYITVPLLWGTGLRPSQRVAVSGILYEPKAATNPGGFNFKAYLAAQGCFAGMSGRQVEVLASPKGVDWFLWVVRQKIVKAQVFALGSPGGLLTSAMVLGGQAVDLPYDIRDQFSRAGLAHVMAASGFQTSLILGVVLALTRPFSEKVQFGIGSSLLGIYLSLSGFQPSVLRASLMGAGALGASVAGRKVKPVGSLLATGVILLVISPTWIWNLGFQLSFLATLGLLVMVQPLVQWLNWLPPAIASLIAVPLAAYVWTLPLLLYTFGLVSPYTVLLNILVTPLVSIISLGGMVSALGALVWPSVGSLLAWALYYPVQIMLFIVQSVGRLPGSAYAAGTLSLVQLVVLYGVIGLVWWRPEWQKRWWVATLVAIMLIVVPAGIAQARQVQVTVLSTSGQPVMVIQDRGRVGLINCGDEITAKLTVVPFLQQQGVNSLDWAIATINDSQLQDSWEELLAQIPAQQLYQGTAAQSSTTTKAFGFKPLQAGQDISLATTTVRQEVAQLPLWSLQIRDQRWLLVGQLGPKQQQMLIQKAFQLKPQVLWWSGDRLAPEVLKHLKPQVAIASANRVDVTTARELAERGIVLYLTGENGAVQWTPNQGFRTSLSTSDVDATAFYN